MQCYLATHIRHSARKSIPLHTIHPVRFFEQLEDQKPPIISNESSADQLCADISICIYQYATSSRMPPSIDAPFPPNLSRWQRIIDYDDLKMLSRAIEWKGEFNPTPDKEKCTDLEFQGHLEKLLNPSQLEDEA